MMLHETLREAWRSATVMTLQDERTRYVIQPEAVPHHFDDPVLQLVNVHIDEHQADRRRSVVAERATIEMIGGPALEDSSLIIEVHNASLTVEETTIERVKTTLGPVRIPPETIARVQAIPESKLLDSPDKASDELLAKWRARARNARGATLRRITAAINERTAFSISVFVLAILGAALGIILRGAHLMTAFGVSFVPMLFVIIMIVTGKQMSQNPGTHWLGLLVIWSGIVVVAGLDVWTLTRLLRR
jgi:hypothetical protein